MDADEPLITTGVVSQSPAQFAQLWRLREGVTEAVSKEGKAYKYDISVPLASFKDVVDIVREHLRKQGLLHEDAVKHVIGYGHVGDGKSPSSFPCVMLTETDHQATYTSISSPLHTLPRLRLLLNPLSMSSLVSDTALICWPMLIVVVITDSFL